MSKLNREQGYRTSHMTGPTHPTPAWVKHDWSCINSRSIKSPLLRLTEHNMLDTIYNLLQKRIACLRRNANVNVSWCHCDQWYQSSSAEHIHHVVPIDLCLWCPDNYRDRSYAADHILDPVLIGRCLWCPDNNRDKLIAADHVIATLLIAPCLWYTDNHWDRS
jgi:hypothetical protein